MKIKTLMRKIEEDAKKKKWKDFPSSEIGRINFVKISLLSKAT
jgi:hypothetical protein